MTIHIRLTLAVIPAGFATAADLVENLPGPLRVRLKTLPDRLEHAVQPHVRPSLLAIEGEEDLVNRAENRPTLLQVDVLQAELIGSLSELSTELSSGNRLPRAQRSVH